MKIPRGIPSKSADTLAAAKRKSQSHLAAQNQIVSCLRMKMMTPCYSHPYSRLEGKMNKFDISENSLRELFFADDKWIEWEKIKKQIEKTTDFSASETLAAGDLDEPLCVHGNVVVNGNLRVVCPLVVTGSLTVTGVLRDCGPDSVVVIGEDLNCGSLFTDGDFFVGNQITAADVVYGHYNDNSLIAKSTKARLVIEDDHDFQTAVEATWHFDIDDYQADDPELRRILVAEVFEVIDEGEPEVLSQDKLYSLLDEGKKVFLA
jgi:hypothetical protein